MLRTILVEDDFHNLELLSELLIPYKKDISIVAKAQTLKEAVRLIKALNPDLIFLDVHLPDGDGFEVLNRTSDYNYEVIFTTAFSEYSLKAFDFAAKHYLLKPIDEDALDQAINRCLKASSEESSNLLINLEHKAIKKIMVPSLTDLSFVNLNDVLYLEADRSYTKFYLLDETTVLSSKPIGVYEKQLKGAFFSRIHDKYLVNLEHVVRYIKGRGGEVVLVNNKYLDVSTRRKAQFIQEQRFFLG
ncbi:LytR/AlgR family response regulator transcription factor [Aureispira anguillae]|uniref:LytTR family DNA-binding domain-containing protein n=1 Tax=Aureispira anguillae TaxID=2864201 RepID=A0A916DUY1_9BACT|nr:LytTR family DNA-binding domain-containing protein [Aureispira anguillae]BDS13791.1 LytTR family DNA-binding domain-containing protein [Aureispira anguillae]